MQTPLTSRECFRQFVGERPLGVVATCNRTGDPEAALVSLTVTERGDLLFNSVSTARKIDNITTHSHVAVVIGCSGDDTMQIEGNAIIETGDERIAAARAYLAAFPGSRTAAPEIAIVRVQPRWVRYYSVSLTPAHVVEGCPEWIDQHTPPR